MSNVQEKIASEIKNHKIVLYMKGTPQTPMCGFSAAVVQCLKAVGADFHAVNVLENDAIREGVKQFSNWPTIPQLYINGKFIGGCDITRELYENGELKKLLG